MTDQQRDEFFELHYKEIENEVEKRRRKWTLKAVLMLDFDDIKFIIINHIYEKLHLFDQSKPLLNWVNTVASNQIYNILRNTYYNHSRPCLKCACSQPDNGCELYDEQSSKCFLYKKWEETKKHANNIKLALPQDNHLTEVFEMANTHYDISHKIDDFHILMKKHLKPFEYRIYECIYILGLSESNTARKLGYKSKEKWKYRGYTSVAKAKKTILETAKKILENEEIDLI